MCAPVEGDGRDLREEEEEEDAFVVHFIHVSLSWDVCVCAEKEEKRSFFCIVRSLSNHFASWQELSKRGVKLIYHRAPADSSSDWTQLTVRMFLRPGRCHEREVHPPSLSWARCIEFSRLDQGYDEYDAE